MNLKSAFLICLIISLLWACDSKDDTSGIFTGKTWKMTGIYQKKDVERVYKGYWDNEASYQASIEKLKVPTNFTINFEGMELEDAVSGKYNGRATSTNFSGNWTANSKNQGFSTSNQTGSDNDILGRAFLNGLKDAYKYDGDYFNLRIHFKLGNEEMFILFHVADQ